MAPTHPPRRRRARALARWVLCALLALPGWAAAVGVQAFADALVAEGTAHTAFPGHTEQRVVALPDDWGRHPTTANPRWYRLRFDVALAPAASGVLGVYFERLCAGIDVYLNGQRLQAARPRGQHGTPDCHRPLLLSLPAALLRAQGNELDLRVAGFELQQLASSVRATQLPAPLIGPEVQLDQRRILQTVLVETAPAAMTGVLVLAGVLALSIARARRRDVHLRYFALFALGWALLCARPLWQALEQMGMPVEGVLAAAMPWLLLVAVQFLMHYAGWRSRPIEVALVAQCVAMPASLLLAGSQRIYMIASTWYAVLLLQLLGAIAFYIWATWRVRRRDFSVMAWWLGVGAALAVLMLAAEEQRLASPWHLLPSLLAPLVVVGIGWHLIGHYGRALQAAEESRQALELRVREASADMEKNFAQLAEQRVEQVTQQERKRIAADLHDDLGAKLLTIVHTSESERISTLAREALEEMRLSVRGLTGKPVKLIDALGDWRAEVVGRLSQTGVEGEWSAPTDELPQTLSARAYVQTTRILREAVNNIIKHSGASRCTIRCVIEHGDFQLAIQDNGKGIPLELDGRLDRGHGMASMKHRAKQLHGQCLVESGPGYGTVIRLTLPLERHTTNV